MMGLFPNPGQDVYLLTVPFFETVSIVSPLTGKTATLRVVNWSEYNAANVSGAAAGGNGFIQSATLDGKPYTRNWVGHDFFKEGRELVLVLGKEEGSWGTRPEDLPPSLAPESALHADVDSVAVRERRWDSVLEDGQFEGLVHKRALHLGRHIHGAGDSHSGKG
jgi:putative alpha-1,2-mannosidase